MVTGRAQGLEIKSLSVKYGSSYALKNANLKVEPGEVLALVGANGAGKSTLMKVMSGVIPATEYVGEVWMHGEKREFHSVRDAEAAGVTLVPQELLTLPERSVFDNQFLGNEPCTGGVVRYKDAVAVGRNALKKLGAVIDQHRTMGELSASEQQQVQISRALMGSPEIVLFDEPTSSLSFQESESLMSMLRDLANSGTAVILITHRIAEAMSIADKVTVLRNGEIVGSWNADALSADDVVETMLGRQLSVLEGTRAQPVLDLDHSDPVLKVRDVTVVAGARTVVDNTSFDLRPGEIIGLFGLMGAGRTELLETIFGAGPKPLRGSIEVAGCVATVHSPRDRIRRGIGLVTEDRRANGLALDLSLIDNTMMVALRSASKNGVMNRRRERSITQRFVAEMHTKTAAVEQPVGDLSGGNQQKVVISKWLASKPRILLLDEPGRGVDVGAKAEIFKKIKEFSEAGMAVVVASSEPGELEALATKVFVLNRGKIQTVLTGGEISEASLLRAATGAHCEHNLTNPKRSNDNYGK